MWHSNHTWNEMTYNMSVYHLPQYNQPQWVPTSASTASVTCYRDCTIDTYQNIAKLLTHPSINILILFINNLWWGGNYSAVGNWCLWEIIFTRILKIGSKKYYFSY